MQDRRQIRITDNTKLSTTQKKQTTQNTAKHNYPGSVTSYDTRPGNEVGLFNNTHTYIGQVYCRTVSTTVTTHTGLVLVIWSQKKTQL